MTFVKGFKHSEESKKKIGAASKGNTYAKGTVRSEELKRAASERMKRKEFSAETRKKISLSKIGKKRPDFTGENNPKWNGGVSSMNEKIRKSGEYKLWREAVFERDNWTCVWCGGRSAENNPVILNADHIKPFAYFPELRFAIDNGRTLCKPCHLTTDTWGGRAKNNKDSSYA